MKTSAKIAVAGVVVLALGGALSQRLWHTAPAAATGVEPPAAVPVEVAAVKLAPFVEGVESVGTVAARHDVTVSSEAAGRVVAVRVEVGDRVQQGTLLAEVDPELRQLAVEQAEAQLALARGNLAKARRDLERNEPLFAKGDIAGTEMENIRLAFDTATVLQRQAEVALKMARRQAADARIKSPIAGVVTARFVEAGEMLAPGAPVANIVDLAVVKILLSIPEDQIGELALGQEAQVRLDPYPERSFAGKVINISAKATGESHRYPVEVEVTNQDDLPLKAGMFARTRITTATFARLPVIPSAALVAGAAQPSVYVVRQGRAVLSPVVLRRAQGEMVGVSAGLQEGEQVVTVGQQRLSDGVAVQSQEN
ncbi:MAG: efflux RND transporter periplasmic adaptor subunit [Candidatus Latescibacteria bacterium]|nr:efflux RND transporter periplasmic adaptor subunit [Candidatus Latescibacterota bacterium]